MAYFVLAFMGGIRSSLGEAAENLGASPGKELLPDHPSLKRSGDLPGLSHYFYLRLRRL